jgi:hypothetical protein
MIPEEKDNCPKKCEKIEKNHPINMTRSVRIRSAEPHLTER